MHYSEEVIDNVRSNNDIVDIVSQHVHIKKKGSNYFGLCPFHSEKSASFSVSQSKQIYHCFVCGEGGDVISFVMKYENLSFIDALRVLADRAGIILPAENDLPVEKEPYGKQHDLFEITREAAIFYFNNLEAEDGKRGLEYLKERGLSEDTIKYFGLGYSGSHSTELMKYLRKRGYSDAQIVEAGIASFDENKQVRYRFWNRVMFPIVNASGKVVGFGGRVLDDGKSKYLNSPETLIFDKSKNLFGLNYAKYSKKGYLILCEGYMDVIALHQVGFDMAVASLGTSFSDKQAILMKRYTDTVILSYDSDEAGIKATLRGIRILKRTGLKGKVLDLSPYKDPDEFIKNNGSEALEDRIKKAENTFFYELRILESSYDMEDPASKTDFYRKVAERLCEYEEPLERKNYIEAAGRLMIEEADLEKLISLLEAGRDSRRYPI